jgi:ribosomal protein S18 acetylase RimI-like enzyme
VGEEAGVRRVVEDDWRLLRAVRLEMIADTPLAYLETLESARARDEADWRFRARRGSEGAEQLSLAAEDPATPGRWVAYMACFVEGRDRAHLVSVYVAPEQRGTGLAERMVADVCRWARDEAGVRRLELFVHEDNPRARAFYARLGFTETGATMPYELDPQTLEIEMVRLLDGGA